MLTSHWRLWRIINLFFHYFSKNKSYNQKRIFLVPQPDWRTEYRFSHTTFRSFYPEQERTLDFLQFNILRFTRYNPNTWSSVSISVALSLRFLHSCYSTKNSNQWKWISRRVHVILILTKYVYEKEISRGNLVKQSNWQRKTWRWIKTWQTPDVKLFLVLHESGLMAT